MNADMASETISIGLSLEGKKISKRVIEPPRVSRRPNFLREYPNEKYLLT